MNILNFFNAKINDETCMTIGSFDGLHLAHKFLIDLTIKTSQFLKVKSVIFTFIEHPHKNKNLILTKDEKIEMLEKLNVDYIILLDKNVFQIKRDEFLNIIKQKFNIKWIIIGYNHRFGNKREGDKIYLSENVENFGYGLTIVPPIKIDNFEVSSSNIRNFIKEGNIEFANKLLGYNFFMKGIVIKGKGIGRILGYRTANIKVSDEKIIPARGVYLTKTQIDNEIFKSITYIGDAIETHIFNFDRDIYDKIIKIEFFKKISEDIKFENFEDLKNKIREDVLKAKSLWNLLN